MAKRNNGMGTLRKRKDGRWEGRFNAGVDENGKKQVKYILAKTKTECNEKLEKAIKEYEEAQLILNRCAFLNNANPTLEEWYEIWMESFCKASVKEYTANGYKQYFNAKIIPKIGNINIKNLTTVVCQQFLMDLYQNGRIRNTKSKGNGLSVKTVKDIKIALQTCLQKAVDEELIPTNPCKKVQLPKDEPKEMQTLKANELAAFLQETKDSGCYEFYLLEITTGLRLGDDDDKIRLNQRKPSKYKGLSRFGPEKNLQRINKFMKERPTFYKKLIQMKENFRFYLRCFYCITKVVILQFNSEKQDRISS